MIRGGGVSHALGRAKRGEGHTERVDHAFLLLLHAVHATDPLATIAQRSDSFNEMRALESRDKKVPCDYKKKKELRVNIDWRVGISECEKTHIWYITFRSRGTFQKKKKT
jgi:hypothetical protein